MDDEVMERLEGGAAEPRQPSDRDYDSKPVWARAIVISAGVIMNMLFAFLAYSSVAAFWGEPALPTTRVESVDAQALPPGTELLVQIPEGARFSEIGSFEVTNWSEVGRAFIESEAGPLDIRLAEPEMEFTIQLPEAAEDRVAIWGAITYWADAVIGDISPGSPADEGGLETGDRILAVSGESVRNWTEMTDRIQVRAGQRTALLLERAGGEMTRYVTPEAIPHPDPSQEGEVGRIGVLPYLLTQSIYQPLGLTAAMSVGWQETDRSVRLILGFLRDLFTGGVSAREVGSIVTIGQITGQAAERGLDFYLRFMALFSVNLAILNLLPIPVLDGGHLVFLAIEAVRGRALSVEQRLRWSNVGFLIIMGIMIWALGNDILRVFGL
jgi:regulator of sigma E protease